MDWLLIGGLAFLALFLFGWARRAWVKRNVLWPAEAMYEKEWGNHDFDTNSKIAQAYREAQMSFSAYTNMIKIGFIAGVLLLALSFVF